MRSCIHLLKFRFYLDNNNNYSRCKKYVIFYLQKALSKCTMYIQSYNNCIILHIMLHSFLSNPKIGILVYLTAYNRGVCAHRFSHSHMGPTV